jgi:hypothetical protein
MGYVVTFTDYRPSPRFDGVTWDYVTIEEADSIDGPWTQIDSIDLDPVDANPLDPLKRTFTTENVVSTDTWLRVIFNNNQGDLEPTQPIRSPYATTSGIAALVKSLIPMSWEALSKAQWYGESMLDLRIKTAKYTELGDVYGAQDESTYPFALQDFIASIAALEIMPAAIEYWMRQKTTWSATGTNETTSFTDPIPALKRLEERLTLKIARLRGSPTISALLTAPGELPAISNGDDGLMNDTMVTEDPFDWLPAFQGGAGTTGTATAG